MDNIDKEFNEIIDDNFKDPTEDFQMLQFIKWMHHDDSLLSDRELDFFSDEENMIEHLSNTYRISQDEARKVFHYAEDMYLSNPEENSR